jgi:hypothetical protein
MAEEARHDGDAPHGAAAFGTDGEVAGIDLMIAAVVIGYRCGIGWPNG